MSDHVGPGDPVWHGPPDQARIRRVLEITQTDSRGRRYFKQGGSWKRLETAADYEQLNRLLGWKTYRNTSYPVDSVL